MKNILSLKFEEAKQFFLKDESYFNVDLPPYIKFDKVLLAISKYMNNKSYLEIKKQNPYNFDNINYTLMHNKKRKYISFD